MSDQGFDIRITETREGTGVQDAQADLDQLKQSTGEVNEVTRDSIPAAREQMEGFRASTHAAHGLHLVMRSGSALMRGDLLMATQSLTRGLQLLWSAMLANPLTILLAVLGGLVALFIEFKSKIDEAAKAAQEAAAKHKEAADELEQEYKAADKLETSNAADTIKKMADESQRLAEKAGAASVEFQKINDAIIKSQDIKLQIDEARIDADKSLTPLQKLEKKQERKEYYEKIKDSQFDELDNQKFVRAERVNNNASYRFDNAREEVKRAEEAADQAKHLNKEADLTVMDLPKDDPNRKHIEETNKERASQTQADLKAARENEVAAQKRALEAQEALARVKDEIAGRQGERAVLKPQEDILAGIQNNLAVKKELDAEQIEKQKQLIAAQELEIKRIQAAGGNAAAAEKKLIDLKLPFNATPLDLQTADFEKRQIDAARKKAADEAAQKTAIESLKAGPAITAPGRGYGEGGLDFDSSSQLGRDNSRFSGAEKSINDFVKAAGKDGKITDPEKDQLYDLIHRLLAVAHETHNDSGQKYAQLKSEIARLEQIVGLNK